jgi:hypothetical protein
MAASTSSTTATGAEQYWYIAQRWQAYEAEGRANLLRTIAIGVFYLVHLWSYFSSQGKLPNWGVLQLAEPGQINERFHVIVTLLAVAWAMLALGVLLCLQQQIFPRWLPYFTTGCDVVLLTSVLCVSNGARSPLVTGYFLILVLATLRLGLSLVSFATITSAAAYLIVLGCGKWFPLLGGVSSEARVPRYHQLIVLMAIVLAGVMLGQIVRRVEKLAEAFANREYIAGTEGR